MRSEEAALLAAWTRENLEAYGEALRADGDIRGELIALDLALEHATSRAAQRALAEEKQALHVAWLGEVGENVRSRYGFVEEVRDDAEVQRAVFDKIVPHLRRFETAGEIWETREIVERIAAAPRPWLVSLRVCAFTDTQETCVDSALATRLIAATPNLTRLAVDGHCVFDEIAHPGVTDLVLRGFDAIGAMRGKGAVPAVTRLAVTLHPNQYIHREPPPHALREGWLPRAGFPAVTALDLAGNEPGSRTREPNCFGGQTAFFDVLPRIGLLPQIRELRVPSVRSTAHARQLEDTLAAMPALQRCEIARVYGKAPRVRGCVVPPPVAWPPASEIRDHDALVFRVDGAWLRADLADAYRICERRELTPAQQRAWTALWALARTLGTEDETRTLTVPVADVRAAAETATEDQHDWHALADALAEHEGDLEARRIDGFPDTPEDAPAARVAASGGGIEEHERALQARWDLDRLAVYADELQQLGDIRGELIALDLRILREGDPDYELELERDDLHERIFGDTYGLTSKLGFTSLDVAWADDDKLATLLVGDVARYVREIELAGVTTSVERDLRFVLREPRPWLRALRVQTMGELEASRIDWPAVAPAWPNLEELELAFDERTPLFAGFVHPRVTSLRITRVAALAVLGEPWPAVATLDIAFGEDDLDDVPWLLTHARFPALAVLDLARNEPQVGSLDRALRFQGPPDVFAVLARLDPALLARLTHVRVSSPRDAAAVTALQRTLDAMPSLERLEIVRRYPRGPAVALHHPRAEIVVPEPSPWPRLGSIERRATVEIEGIPVSLRDAIRAMEGHADRFAAPGRAAWTTFWRALEDPARTLQMKAADLYAAMAELDEHDRFTNEWTEKLVAALHAPALADAAVRVRRVRRDDHD